MRSKCSWNRSQKSDSYWRLYENSIGKNPFWISPDDCGLAGLPVDDPSMHYRLSSIKKRFDDGRDKRLLQEVAEKSDMFGIMTSEKKIDLKGLFTPNFAKDTLLREQPNQMKDPISSFDDFAPSLTKRPPNRESRVNSKNRRNTGSRSKGGCTCPRSQCANQYCECVRSGNVCSQDCSCLGCQNLTEKKKTHSKSRAPHKQNGFNSRVYLCRKHGCSRSICTCKNSDGKANKKRSNQVSTKAETRDGTLCKASTTDDDTLYCNSDLSLKVAQSSNPSLVLGPRFIRGKL